ncbi:MAG: hypothetical protein Q8R53_03750 [Nanoarchaeota archaeon]|nr:hypothetical protein [Nanoarchaeota archaeon]
MDLQQRIEAMERLSEHAGERVSVEYVQQRSTKPQWSEGVLEYVEPYVFIEVTEDGNSLKRNTGIPFLGMPDAIVSIVREDGVVLYENPHIYPRYNPFYAEDNPETFHYERAKAYAELVKVLSFGKQRLCCSIPKLVYTFFINKP